MTITKLKVGILFIFSISALLVIGCGNNTQSSSNSTNLNPDDIVTVPGLGPQYRANVHEAGTEEHWVPIESVHELLTNSSSPVEVIYRNSINTEAGKTVNNIFEVHLINNDIENLSSSRLEVNILVIDSPNGITTIETTNWHGSDPARRSKVVVEIEINEQVSPGEYTIVFQVEINNEDYGQLPCIINVL